MSLPIGFMQGRLSPMVDGRIQAFPREHWREEFPVASGLGLRVMEWTLDHERLEENPIMTAAGREEIRSLCARYDVSVPSLTGDCFMQAPFFKARGPERVKLLDEMERVLDAAAAIGMRLVVVPLVDAGSLHDEREEESLRSGLDPLCSFLADAGIRIVFESDFPPQRLREFMEGFDPRCFGVNYDTGNSAALGYDVEVELGAYGARVHNVHIKDRLLGGTTVPLGEGEVDFPRVFSCLRSAGYSGNLILQTARAADGSHASALDRYRKIIEDLNDGAGDGS